MASEELASLLYNLVCRYVVYYNIFEYLYLSGQVEGISFH